MVQEQNGIVRGYFISICHWDFNNCWSELSTDTHYTITGLHPFYQYNINVAALTTEAGQATAYKSVTCLEDGRLSSHLVKLISFSNSDIFTEKNVRISLPS